MKDETRERNRQFHAAIVDLLEEVRQVYRLSTRQLAKEIGIERENLYLVLKGVKFLTGYHIVQLFYLCHRYGGKIDAYERLMAICEKRQSAQLRSRSRGSLAASLLAKRKQITATKN